LGATTRIPKSLNGAAVGREAPTANAKSRNGLGGKGKPRPISEAKKSPQSEWGPVSKIVSWQALDLRSLENRFL
jgi:hypothetical protein